MKTNILVGSLNRAKTELLTHRNKDICYQVGLQFKYYIHEFRSCDGRTRLGIYAFKRRKNVSQFLHFFKQ